MKLSIYACKAPETHAPPPGAVGLDYHATCPVCGRRVAVTARGRFARHRRPTVRAKEAQPVATRQKVPATITVCDACGEAACWEGTWMCERSRSAGTTVKEEPGYRCQFCGETSPVKKWKRGGDECPKCGRIYDAVLAQDEP